MDAAAMLCGSSTPSWAQSSWNAAVTSRRRVVYRSSKYSRPGWSSVTDSEESTVYACTMPGRFSFAKAVRTRWRKSSGPPGMCFFSRAATSA